MKLGVSYNLFDGEELLEGSIKQIRPFASHISVVYQNRSNLGNKALVDLFAFLKDLKDRKIIDLFYLYEPQEVLPRINEISKRNIGLDIARINDCTHYMSMDSDEYYLQDNFFNLIKDIEEKSWDATFCQMRTFYKSWEFQIMPPEDYYVPLIYKIYDNSKFDFNVRLPVLTDPTRMYPCHNFKIYNRSFIEMYHGSYIRNNIRSKVENSTAVVNLQGHNHKEKIIKHFEDWQYPQKALLMGVDFRYFDVIKVPKNF